MAGSDDDASAPKDQVTTTFSFEEESTVAVKAAFFEDDPTEPAQHFEGSVEDPTTAPEGAMAPMSAEVLGPLMAEIARLGALAGSRSARLNHDVSNALRLAVALPGPTRLSPEQAIAAASGLLSLTDDQYARAARLLERAGLDDKEERIPFADRDGERALILRAVAERRGQLETGMLSQFIRRLGIPVSSDRNLKEIVAFAEEIRGRKGR